MATRIQGPTYLRTSQVADILFVSQGNAVLRDLPPGVQATAEGSRMNALAPWQRWLSERFYRLSGERWYLRWVGPIAVPKRRRLA